MQIILADAKVMREKADGKVPSASIPQFENEATGIANEMARLSVADIARLFHCSTSIAMENQQRFLSFKASDHIPAIKAFYGQAYKYLQADSLSEADLRLCPRPHFDNVFSLWPYPTARCHPFVSYASRCQIRFYRWRSAAIMVAKPDDGCADK